MRTSPDGFSILRQEAEGAITVDAWSAGNEKNDAAAVAAGTMKACYVIVSRKAFACCEAKPAEQRADYDRALDRNTAAAHARWRLSNGFCFAIKDLGKTIHHLSAASSSP